MQIRHPYEQWSWRQRFFKLVFYWVATAAGFGDVVFYCGFNSNFDGRKEGGRAYLSTLTLKESPRSAIINTDKNISAIRIYYNSIKNLVEINFTLKNQSFVLKKRWIFKANMQL